MMTKTVKFKTNLSPMNKVIGLCSLLFIASSCGVLKQEAKESPSDSSSEASPTPNPTPEQSGTPILKCPQEPCAEPLPKRKTEVQCKLPDSAPAELTKSPSKISDIVAILNLLPKPVSFACLVDSLPRPLKISATTSTLSVQPAWSDKNPRIFLTVGQTLIGFVPDGPASTAIELSELLSDTVSVKAEIMIPVKENIPTDLPYSQILKPDATGSKCSACHFNESPAGSAFPPSAFKSKAIRYLNNQNYDLYNIWELARDCGNTDSERCDSLRSLFRDEKTERYVFPPSMPSMF